MVVGCGAWRGRWVHGLFGSERVLLLEVVVSESLESVVNKIAEILPEASLGFDNDGQLIIYTDLFINLEDIKS